MYLVNKKNIANSQVATKLKKIAVIYAPQNAVHFQKLENHLTTSRENLEIWHTGTFSYGNKYAKFRQEIDLAQVVLLLISPNFFGGTIDANHLYCYDLVKKKHEKQTSANKQVVIPIIIRDCLWKEDKFLKTRIALPFDEKPLFDEQDRLRNDTAIKTVVKEIKRILKGKTLRKPPTSFQKFWTFVKVMFFSTLLLLSLQFLLPVIIQYSLPSEKLHIKSGKTKVITATNETEVMELQELIMDNNSILRLEGMQNWKLQAYYAQIGHNCKIIGTGKTGNHGNGGVAGASRRRCDDENWPGGEGTAGTHGTNGTSGVDIHLLLGLAKLGSLEINCTGGHGGNGGNGGRGGNGANAFASSSPRTCNGKHGGKGGRGGNAGKGGNGGNVTIEYVAVGNKAQINNNKITNNIIIKNKAGDYGEIGLGGEPGAGGRADSENYTFYRVRRSGGGPGSKGSDGIRPEPPAKDGDITTESNYGIWNQASFLIKSWN